MTLPTTETIEFPHGDYVSPGLALIKPDFHFPNMVIGDKGECEWEYLRREVDHNWYVDRRWPSIGFLDRDEAHILYNSALQFRHKRALEIGCWLGWSACHIAMAGMDIDVIDPLLADSGVQESVTASLCGIFASCDIVLVPGKSPEAVLAIGGEEHPKWSFIFIDSDYRYPSPVLDAHAAARSHFHCSHWIRCPVSSRRFGNGALVRRQSVVRASRLSCRCSRREINLCPAGHIFQRHGRYSGKRPLLWCGGLPFAQLSPYRSGAASPP